MNFIKLKFNVVRNKKINLTNLCLIIIFKSNIITYIIESNVRITSI